ncbi:Aste57867_1948 [Aphanomyces stellatus]|uniref:Aste57867_1948 protein n=1 Tax=Aphanomyces stellatus TaxID=120398 RepID=A0A485KA01_9STRA|nr:hypothetical protein As57867_001946 [Aphanomyces stellatus]VFT79153.1 Aste57867_1948 [Aphanomyces stellatus]
MPPSNKWTESSDFVARFKDIYAANPSAGVVTYDGIPIPTVVTDRLNAHGLTFSSLPNLMRQALLWDMGWVVGDVGGVDTFMQVYVPANTTMASIALPWAVYQQSAAGFGLKHTQCTFNGKTYLRQQVMAGPKLPPILKCAVDLVSVDAQSSLLAQDALSASIVPEPRLYRHQDTTQGWTMPAIHTLPRVMSTSGEAAWGTCPSEANHQALIIPCETKYASATSLNTFLPVESASMTAWLDTFQVANPNLATKTPPPTTTISSSSVSSMSTGWIVGLGLGGGVLVVAVSLWLVRRCRRRHRSTNSDDDDDTDLYLAGPGTNDHIAMLHSQTAKSSSRSSQSSHGSTDHTAPPPSSSKLASRSSLLVDGINLAPLTSVRLDETAVHVDVVLGSGGFAQVLLGTYAGTQRVAVKGLLPGRASLQQVQDLMDEILLVSRFQSPYIVTFVGAVWDKPIDLACVLEYMDQGDLRDYLGRHTPAQFPWGAKLKCIDEIVHGLVYLHSFPIIHRDLKSRNVLLDATKGTKLTDFGVSRRQTDATMTNAIGTGRWIAPEVLQCDHYSVAADVYSLGVLLSEFCTHDLPYSECINPFDGKPLIETAIMAMVVAGSIQPTYTADMPPFLKDMALQCIHHDPARRPTALALSKLLEREMEAA